MKHPLSLLLALLIAGCVQPRPLRPGSALTRSGYGASGRPEFSATMEQPENPAQSATQTVERTSEADLPFPAGAALLPLPLPASAQHGHAPPAVQYQLVLAQPALQHTRVSEVSRTTVGAAQKDLARELGAKLAATRPIMWVGLALFLFGIATLAYPPLRLAVGSITTSVAITGGGLALLVLPTLVVGNELIILGAVALAVGAWALAHRHGHLRGLLAATSPPAVPETTSPPLAQPTGSPTPPG